MNTKVTLKQRRAWAFGILSLPALLITFRLWLWIMGAVEDMEGERMILGMFFCVINFGAAAVIASQVGGDSV
jgi:hypothetical protein